MQNLRWYDGLECMITKCDMRWIWIVSEYLFCKVNPVVFLLALNWYVLHCTIFWIFNSYCNFSVMCVILWLSKQLLNWIILRKYQPVPLSGNTVKLTVYMFKCDSSQLSNLQNEISIHILVYWFKSWHSNSHMEYSRHNWKMIADV